MPGGGGCGTVKPILAREGRLTRQYVKIRRQGAVAVVTMDNPPTLNAMDQDLGPALARALEEAGREAAVRALVLTGAGGVYSAGGNLARAHRHLQEHPGEGAGRVFAGYTKWVHRVLAAILDLPVPLVSAVEGAASGAGLGWMLLSEVVVASREVKLLTGFVGVGLVPGAGVSLSLTRLLGARRAAELLMLNRPLAPARALEWGLVDELVPPGRALARALELAGELARGPRGALACTRSLLARAAWAGLLPQAEAERRRVMVAADLPAFRRRVGRFMQKKRSARSRLGSGKEG